MCMRKITPYIRDEWSKTIEGQETAYYVISEFEEEVTERWKSPRTCEQYGDYLQRIILPHINDKSLSSYSTQEINDILLQLSKVKMKRHNRIEDKDTYSPSTLKAMENIIKRIFLIAMRHGICDDIFWIDKKLLHGKSYTEKRKEEKTRLAKSLKIEVEKAVAKMLLNDPMMVGEQMALLLMFAFGLRNSEARGVVYRNIMNIDGRYYLATHSTPDDETATITIGGKTYNMYRILPIPELVLPILLARKAYLEAEFVAGRIKQDPTRGINSVLDIPIANSERDWTKPCSADRLLIEGRAFLREAEIEGNLVYYLSEEMTENYSELVYGKEKDLTAYVLRRTYGEHLRDCGCNLAQVERCMGHVQTDDMSRNSDFTNPDKLRELTEILSRRPLLNAYSEIPVVNMAIMEETVLENVSEVIIEFPRKDYDAEYIVRVVSNVNHVRPAITLEPIKGAETKKPYIMEYQTHHRPVTQREKTARAQDINVLYDYQNQYK